MLYYFLKFFFSWPPTYAQTDKSNRSLFLNESQLSSRKFGRKLLMEKNFVDAICF